MKLKVILRNFVFFLCVIFWINCFRNALDRDIYILFNVHDDINQSFNISEFEKYIESYNFFNDVDECDDINQYIHGLPVISKNIHVEYVKNTVFDVALSLVDKLSIVKQNRVRVVMQGDGLVEIRFNANFLYSPIDIFAKVKYFGEQNLASYLFAMANLCYDRPVFFYFNILMCDDETSDNIISSLVATNNEIYIDPLIALLAGKYYVRGMFRKSLNSLDAVRALGYWGDNMSVIYGLGCVALADESINRFSKEFCFGCKYCIARSTALKVLLNFK